MLRRTLLRKGAILAGTALFAAPAAAKGRRSPPNENVSNTVVTPFDSDQSVAKGDWITHQIGWVDLDGGGDSTYEDVARWLEAVELEYFIDGERIKDAKQYYGDIEQNEDGKYITWFEYTTPPKKPGEYTFSIRHRYPDGYDDSDDDETTRDTVRYPGQVIEFSGTYVVGSKPSRKK